MKCNKKTTAFYMCLALVMAGLMFSGCGKSKGGGGEATNKGNWYQDSDNDGFGNPDKTNNSTEQPEGYVDNSKDCNDENAAINPAVVEIINDNMDNNCNDEKDETPKAGIIPDTGQIISYTDTFGEDSDYIIDKHSYTKLDTNGQILPDSATSWRMIKDNVTGLIWEIKDASDGVENLLNIHDADNTYTWEQASSTFIAKLNADAFGNFNDGLEWRLPTIRELSYLANSSLVDHSVPSGLFISNLISNVWSSTPNVSPVTKAWFFSTYVGSPAVVDKKTKCTVWAVRGKDNSSDFENYSSGIVIDKATGLMWQTETVTGDEGTGVNFENALKYCENLELGGFKDWRLPNKNELQSLIRFDLVEPSIDHNLFSNTLGSYYWTSTTYIASNAGSKYAWILDFDGIEITFGLKTSLAWVRAVRGGNNTTTKTWFRDGDGDGYGDSAVMKNINASSPQPTGYILDHTDCNDADSTISPAAAEIAGDGIDQNCTGSDTFIWYKDNDNDGFGNAKIAVISETKPQSYIHNTSDIAAGLFDCNDSNKSINPAMEELVDDGLDNDCNGLQSVSWYIDSDGDGYGDGLRAAASEAAPANGTYSTNDLDCNDGNSAIHPGLVELFGDLFDSNCNGDNYDEGQQIVPDTGQVESYTGVPGEDGDYLINPPTLTKIDSNGGLLASNAETWFAVRDNVTGLYWEVKTTANRNAFYTYTYAVDYANSLELASFTDWRLPTIAELATIAHLGLSNPAIDTAFFPNMASDKYWTATDLGSSTKALAISFRYGESYDGNKTDYFRVLSVRGGQSNENRLISNSDGTITDTETSLMWNSAIFTAGGWDDSVYWWSHMADTAGYSDWRIPSESDIDSLLNILEEESSINLSTVLLGASYSGSFWTSTLALTDPGKAVVFSLITGETDQTAITETLRGVGVRGGKQSRFIVNVDGTVFDSKTGLMWMRENGNSGFDLTFEGALSYCNTTTFAGYNDWRLPNRNEMLSLLAAFITNSTEYSTAFPNSNDNYWTSSSSSDSSELAWQISYETGSIALSLGDYSNNNVFRAVRGGNPE